MLLEMKAIFSLFSYFSPVQTLPTYVFCGDTHYKLSDNDVGAVHPASKDVQHDLKVSPI